MAIVGDALMDMHGIAKIAGVSSATVSRVINGSKLVRPETTGRVQRVIDELKFFPNSSATTLKHGKSSTYGLIIPDITNPFFPEFIRCFEKILVENNRDMLMATIDSHATRMQQSVRRMLVRKVDGVVLLAAEIETEPIEALIHNKVPLVTLERRLVAPWVSDVMVNYAAGIGLAVAHLKELGHTKIGYIGASAGPTISNHRVNGFKKALKKYGLQLYPEFIRVGDYRTTGGQTGMTELLALKERPTAILAANDLTAIGALRTIYQRGYTVPGDFSVIGFDDIDLAGMLYPPLTTLCLPRQELAETVYKALEFGREHKSAVGQQYTMKTSLVVRESSGVAKAAKRPRSR